MLTNAVPTLRPSQPQGQQTSNNSFSQEMIRMNIIIQRDRPRGEYVHGQLTIDGNRVCQTLENALSCVPAGEYVISLLKCKQYSRKMPCLKAASKREESQACLSYPEREQARPKVNANAPCLQCPKLKFVCSNSTLPCYCPQIKPGNGVHDRHDGSIIVWQYNCLGSIIKPRNIFDALYERIRKSISRGNVVTLIIKDG